MKAKKLAKRIADAIDIAHAEHPKLKVSTIVHALAAVQVALIEGAFNGPEENAD